MLFTSMKLFRINLIGFLFRNNPQNPCPCSLGQAQIDRRFSRLYSETSYETSQGVICYGPLTTSWIRLGWNFQPLRTQVNRKIFLVTKTEIIPSFVRHVVTTCIMEV